MKRVAVLVSGGGTNLQALLESERRGENPNGKIELVVASKPGVYALERAANFGVAMLLLSAAGTTLTAQRLTPPCWTPCRSTVLTWSCWQAF